MLIFHEKEGKQYLTWEEWTDLFKTAANSNSKSGPWGLAVPPWMQTGPTNSLLQQNRQSRTPKNSHTPSQCPHGDTILHTADKADYLEIVGKSRLLAKTRPYYCSGSKQQWPSLQLWSLSQLQNISFKDSLHTVWSWNAQVFVPALNSDECNTQQSLIVAWSHHIWLYYDLLHGNDPGKTKWYVFIGNMECIIRILVLK